MKDTVIWNIEQGLKLTPADLERAERAASRARRAHHGVFRDARVSGAADRCSCCRFPSRSSGREPIEGVPMATYIDWMATCYAISCTGLPAISVPCGFSAAGCRWAYRSSGGAHRDADVLALARAFEQATQFARRRPLIGVE